MRCMSDGTTIAAGVRETRDRDRDKGVVGCYACLQTNVRPCPTPIHTVDGYMLMRMQLYRSSTHPLHKQHLLNPLYLVPTLPPLPLTLLILILFTLYRLIKPTAKHPHPNSPLRLPRPLAPQQRPRQANILHLRPRTMDTDLCRRMFPNISGKIHAGSGRGLVCRVSCEGIRVSGAVAGCHYL